MFRRFNVWTLGLAAAACVVLLLPASAAEGEAGVQIGLTLPDRDISGMARTSRDLQFSGGFRGGFKLSENWGWFADALFTQFDTAGTDVDLRTLRTGAEYRFGGNGDKRWFVDMGAGQMTFDIDNAPSVDRLFLSAGIGQRTRVREHMILRWQLRMDNTIEDDGFGGAGIAAAHLLGGLAWGGGKRVDSDGDGVWDSRDRCPDTPRGATVDERGCPKDSDGDGVWDGLDRCPDTPQGWPVDGNGCPRDSDGDGVVDGQDKCPDTPRGAVVDERGCPKDGDGDGVWDGLDKCPDTPKGATVDRRGCPKDSDGDGVWDGIDACPGTPKGATVDRRGCPKDSDGDGVYDGLDRCPDTPRGTPVDEKGCPKLFDEETRVLILEGVNFETDSAVLTAASRVILDRVAGSLAEWPEIRVEVGGHTDSDGSASYNQRLSLARASAVADYLASKGIDRSRMTARGYGEERPIADNGTAAGKARNRRVELTRLD